MTILAGQASGSTAVNLSKLPFPAVIEAISFEAIVAEAKALLVAEVTAEDATAGAALEATLQLESEPLVKLIEIFAYREVMLRQRINDAARAVTLAYAVGPDLDHLVALLGVQRLELSPESPDGLTPAVFESDEALRRRALLAPEAFSVAGPEGAYIFHALDASGDVLDASATSPDPGVVLVTVLSRLDGGEPSAVLLDLVEARVSAEDVRPLTDQVVVAAAEIIEYAIEAEITTFAGPDSELVLVEAQRRVEEYRDACFRLGRDATRSGIIAALFPEGVQNVNLVSPAANVVVSRQQAARCTGIILTHAGLGE
ncbi:MAG: baseplate J/gp47 family protein [Brevundimonas sp.]|uniref:baseplate assembly protein n=1 Tax=Brevundimonas sp. TaxID=1871086 RepID=UPI00391A8785